MRRWSMVLAAAALATAATAPAFAAETMMRKGETVMMMPNGQMARMMHTDKAMTDAMMKDAKPMDGCVMMMMGSDGKMYMANDMQMANGKMACESAMKMKKK
ncbi:MULTISPECIES: hypothetical protein [Kaistia]|uniref:DUF305 domain-containing protein n=1 Tax=Kaistia nematophila TaxID=2994654 RepID=A0A9X3IMQ0_9HYPH|nr:hypothetical protein [Kaistia nematophila]MBN9058694.1 hypothetical protein [Hyphomicrobiales bacterium]MCX5571773.1 hypothetical protein [Kaistia nematophila]